MARIRTIKPEFPESESMGRISREARLLFIMLWLACDDEGKTRGHSRKLASTLYPYDEDAPKLIDRWLGELERENVVIRYQVDGSTYLKVTAWSKHQKIDRPSKSRLPDPSESDGKPPIRESSRALDNPPEGHAKAVEALAEASREVDEHSRLYLGPRTLDLGPQDSEANASGTDVPDFPIDDISPSEKIEALSSISPPQLSLITAPADPVAEVWGYAIPLLMRAGKNEDSARRFLGKLCKTYEAADVLDAFETAEAKAVPNPGAYAAGILTRKSKKVQFNGNGQFGARRTIDDNPEGNFAAITARLRAGREGRETFDA